MTAAEHVLNVPPRRKEWPEITARAVIVVLMAAFTVASCVTLARDGREGFALIEQLLFPLAAVEALTLLTIAIVVLAVPDRATENPVWMLASAGIFVAMGTFFTAGFKYFAVAGVGWQEIVMGSCAVVSLCVSAPGAVVVSLIMENTKGTPLPVVSPEMQR